MENSRIGRKEEVDKMRFVENQSVDEDVLFVSWGALGAGKDKSRAIVVKENESIEGVIENIKDSDIYGKIYTMRIEGKDKPVIITGKTALNNAMGHGTLTVRHVVQPGDLVRITYLGQQKGEKGRKFFAFRVEVAVED